MQGWHQPKYYYFRSHCDQNCDMQKLLKFNYNVIMHKYSSYLFSVDDRPLALPSHRSEMWSVQYWNNE